MRLIPGGNACLRSVHTGWISAAGPTARVTRTATGVTFSINRSDLGNTDELNFSAVVGGDPVERRRAQRDVQLLARARWAPNRDFHGAERRADKAGGTSDGGPVVLTLASHDYNAIEASEFASAVERLSDGSVRVDVKYGFRFYDVAYEQGTIADVRNADVRPRARGRARLGCGRSEELQRARGSVPRGQLRARAASARELVDRRMLDGVEPLGLVGIAVVPGELRRPLGLSRALVRPADYRGARAESARQESRTRRSTLSAQTRRGFRATPEGLVGFDGAESGVSTIKEQRLRRGRPGTHGERGALAETDDDLHESRGVRRAQGRAAGRLEAGRPRLSCCARAGAGDVGESSSHARRADLADMRSAAGYESRAPADGSASRRATRAGLEQPERRGTVRVRPVYDEPNLERDYAEGISCGQLIAGLDQGLREYLRYGNGRLGEVEPPSPNIALA